MNRRELATVLAALRQRQQQMEHQELVSCYDLDLSDIADDGGTVVPLTVEEIDALCERLNAGES